ncbi:MAG TPA: hypothetical protein VED17_09665, partial [Nitrososphaerales archaeon]|nr:hypothetical protein [Nitrososphaerales archaeon]
DQPARSVSVGWTYFPSLITSIPSASSVGLRVMRVSVWIDVASFPLLTRGCTLVVFVFSE